MPVLRSKKISSDSSSSRTPVENVAESDPAKDWDPFHGVIEGLPKNWDAFNSVMESLPDFPGFLPSSAESVSLVETFERFVFMDLSDALFYAKSIWDGSSPLIDDEMSTDKQDLKMTEVGNEKEDKKAIAATSHGDDVVTTNSGERSHVLASWRKELRRRLTGNENVRLRDYVLRGSMAGGDSLEGTGAVGLGSDPASGLASEALAETNNEYDVSGYWEAFRRGFDGVAVGAEAVMANIIVDGGDGSKGSTSSSSRSAEETGKERDEEDLTAAEASDNDGSVAVEWLRPQPGRNNGPLPVSVAAWTAELSGLVYLKDMEEEVRRRGLAVVASGTTADLRWCIADGIAIKPRPAWSMGAATAARGGGNGLLRFGIGKKDRHSGKSTSSSSSSSSSSGEESWAPHIVRYVITSGARFMIDFDPNLDTARFLRVVGRCGTVPLSNAKPRTPHGPLVPPTDDLPDSFYAAASTAAETAPDSGSTVADAPKAAGANTYLSSLSSGGVSSQPHGAPPPPPPPSKSREGSTGDGWARYEAAMGASLRFHGGMFGVAEALLDDIEPFLRHTPASAEVQLIGHSLGGSTSIIMRALLALRCGYTTANAAAGVLPPVSVFTFGSVPVTDTSVLMLGSDRDVSPEGRGRRAAATADVAAPTGNARGTGGGGEDDDVQSGTPGRGARARQPSMAPSSLGSTRRGEGGSQRARPGERKEKAALKRRRETVLAALGLSLADSVHDFVLPWDPIPRMMSGDDPMGRWLRATPAVVAAVEQRATPLEGFFHSGYISSRELLDRGGAPGGAPVAPVGRQIDGSGVETVGPKEWNGKDIAKKPFSHVGKMHIIVPGGTSSFIRNTRQENALQRESRKQKNYAYYKNKIKRKIKENIPAVARPELLTCAAADASRALAVVLDGESIVGGIGPQPQHFARCYWAHFGYERELGKLSRSQHDDSNPPHDEENPAAA